jgi:hypothetical protein
MSDFAAFCCAFDKVFVDFGPTAVCDLGGTTAVCDLGPATVLDLGGGELPDSLELLIEILAAGDNNLATGAVTDLMILLTIEGADTFALETSGPGREAGLKEADLGGGTAVVADLGGTAAVTDLYADLGALGLIDVGGGTTAVADLDALDVIDIGGGTTAVADLDADLGALGVTDMGALGVIDLALESLGVIDLGGGTLIIGLDLEDTIGGDSSSDEISIS